MQRRNSYFFLFFVIVLGALSTWGFLAKQTLFGLDIKGGVRLTYRVDLAKDQIGKTTMEQARAQIIPVLHRRASGLGAAEPLIAAKGEDQIVVEIPGVKDPNKAREVIGSSARIEFYHARNVNTNQVSTRQFTENERVADNNPSVDFVRNSDKKEIKFGTQEYKDMIAGWTLILAGGDLAKASGEPSPGGGGYRPFMEFSTEGTRKMSSWSNLYKGKEEKLAAVLDGRVLSIAGVVKDITLSSNCVITGTFTPEYVNSLVSLLNAGSLPASLTLLGDSTVSATIGDSAYTKIVTAGLISFGIISLYLVVYYAFPGLVALIALVLYTLFTLTALKLIEATFSLAAIAGFILSVGMAVDANILVFERFKEEMRAGRPLKTAIEIGFKRALPAIIDSNACTILTSLVLTSMGTGPVKGFATTLIIGVVISLFTAVTVTRSLLLFLVGSGIGEDKRWYALDRDWFGKFLEGGTILKVVQKSKLWFIISVVTVLFGLIFVPLGGFKLNVELQGGSELTYALPAGSTKSSNEIAESLEKGGFKGATVKFTSAQAGSTLAIVSVPASSTANIGDNADMAKKIELVQTKVAEAGGISDAKYDGGTTIGPTLQREVQLGAVNGVLVSILLIVGYLAVRFGSITAGPIMALIGVPSVIYVAHEWLLERNPAAFYGIALVGIIALLGYLVYEGGKASWGLRFSLSAIGALFHDILVVVFMAAFFGFVFSWDISSLFLTAMLTIIGFSVHDTIVIFDRIRENLRHQESGEELEHLVNKSVTQSFSRSLNTSGTVILTLLLLVFFGTVTPDLKFFVVTMLLGILSGTYSSIYNASPILYIWDRAVTKKHGPEMGLIALSKADAAQTARYRAQAQQHTPRPGTAGGTGTTTPTEGGTPGRTYGQVRRRAKDSVKDSWRELD